MSQGIRDNSWRQGMMGGIKAQYDCIEAFSDSGPLSARLLRHAATKFYPGLPHGMPTTHAARINADLLAFITSEGRTA